jgi:hypothetical protein
MLKELVWSLALREYQVCSRTRWGLETKQQGAGENFIIRVCTASQTFGWSNRGGLDGWGMYGSEEKCIKLPSLETQGKRLSRISRCHRRLKWVETDWEAVEWIHVAQDVDKWWAAVNTWMHSRRLRMASGATAPRAHASGLRSSLWVC